MIEVMNNQLTMPNGQKVFCTMGRAGITQNKQEGDEKTPAGSWPLRCLYYRSDRVKKPKTALPCYALTPEDGWCDDPADRAYNRFVTLPYEASHEELWRDDHLYDVIIVPGYNDDPPVAGLGSAVFIHIADKEGRPTKGCIGLLYEDICHLLSLCTVQTILTIRAA